MKEAETYQKGNIWQNNRYSFMAQYNKTNGITSFGNAKKNGNYYHHIIDSEKNDPTYNLLGEQKILDEVEKRFKTKAGDKKRVLTNTVASQPCCFNLFAPLKFKENSDLTNKLFSNLLGKTVTVENIIIEFTPDKIESIGDQSKFGGTDADIAVFYSDSENRDGIILIEFKYIENEFSTCTSYRNKSQIRDVCDSQNFHNDKFGENITNGNQKPDCGYLKYDNWKLTEESAIFSLKKIKKSNCCPFKFSLNQLWRNMLLAEKIAKKRTLSEFHFWVLYPKQNTFLWKNHKQDIENNFRNIMTSKGNLAFRLLDIERDFIETLETENTNKWTENWVKNFRKKYLSST